MSWSNYLVDKENEVLIPIGKVNYGDFIEDMKLWGKIKDKMDEIAEMDLTDKRISNFQVKDLKELIEVFELLQQLSWSNTFLFALDIALGMEKIEIIGEEEAGKHKYKALWF